MKKLEQLKATGNLLTKIKNWQQQVKKNRIQILFWFMGIVIAFLPAITVYFSNLISGDQTRYGDFFTDNFDNGGFLWIVLALGISFLMDTTGGLFKRKKNATFSFIQLSIIMISFFLFVIGFALYMDNLQGPSYKYIKGFSVSLFVIYVILSIYRVSTRQEE